MNRITNLFIKNIQSPKINQYIISSTRLAQFNMSSSTTANTNSSSLIEKGKRSSAHLAIDENVNSVMLTVFFLPTGNKFYSNFFFLFKYRIFELWE